MSLFRTYSQCGHISKTCSKCGHNSQTCNNGEQKSIKLFGVQLTEGTNNNNTNLSQYQQLPPQISTSNDASNVSDNIVHSSGRGQKSIMLFGVQLTGGTNNNNTNFSQYQQLPSQVSTSNDVRNVFDNVIHASVRSRKCKQVNEGIWSEEEHKMFLKGLKKFGKGKWTKISTDFVKTRTATQVASHAQKHFLLRQKHNCRRNRKPSVFDLTINTEVESSTIMEYEQIQQETMVPLPPPTSTAYPSTHNADSPTSIPLPIGLDPIPLSVRPLSWVDNDNESSSSTETFPFPLKLQSLPPYDDHSPEISSPSSSLISSSTFNSMFAPCLKR